MSDQSLLTPSLVQSFGVQLDHSVEWLWPGRLPLGKLAILDGDPGLGKSLVTLDIAARITTGRPFPDGAAAFGPASVLLLNGEDDLSDTIQPRLRDLGADLNRVFALSPAWLKDLNVNSVTLPTHLPLINEALTMTSARLLVIDPIMAFLDKST